MSEPQVAMQLLCDAEKLSAGEEFSLVAVFDISPGWHIYWENCGDSGLPTRVKIDCPPGFEASAAIYPGPTRQRAPGGIENFVYEDQVALFIPVRAPLDLVESIHLGEGANALEFVASGEWLVCRELCYLQASEDRVRVTRNVIAEGDRVPSEDLTRWRERLPRPMTELAGLSVEWRHERGRPLLQIAVEGASDLEFFPGSHASLRPHKIVTEREHAQLTVIYGRPRDDGASARFAEGVLRVRRDGTDRFYSIEAQFDSAHEGPELD